VAAFLSALMVFTFVLAVLAPFVPFALLAVRGAFPGALPFCILFSVIVLEKIYAMLFRMRTKELFRVTQDWTSAAVGVSYSLAMYATITEFFGRGTGVTVLPAALFGGGLYLFAVALRYRAFDHLGRHWAVHVDRGTDSSNQLVRTGPYRLIRHPLYVGACLECLAVPLLLNSFWSLLFAAVVFCPLEVLRARFEEGFLFAAFGEAYRDYARDVPGFLPRLGRRGKRGPGA